jgi:hypothetical protein
MTPEVEAAVNQLRRQYAGNVLVAEDKSGGACVIVEGESLGPAYVQSESWVGFHITDKCPYADTYPHFVRGDLSRKDKAAFGEGLSPGQKFPLPEVLKRQQDMPTRPAIQISRRSNRRDPAGFETPLIKLMKVLRWMRSL